MIAAALRQFFVKSAIPNCRIVAAVSGGIDSTALLVGFAELQLDVICAHVNHHLRGAESDDDEAFVRDLCANLNVPLHIADGTLDPARVKDRGIEAAAREIRYARLSELRAATGAKYVATAHQKNDQAETVLMRLLTGSGIAGLRGIHPIRDDGFIRPLLDVTREEIEAFLQERGIRPRIDRSNADPRFLRNRVRVFLQEIGGIASLAKVAEQAREQWPLLERAIDEAERDCAVVDVEETRFEKWPESAWLRGALLQRHIRRLDPHARDLDATRIASQLNEIKRMTVTKTLELVRKGNALVLRRPPQAASEFEIEFTDRAYVPELDVTIRVASAPAAGQPFELPKGSKPAFTIRNRRPGNRFQPLGLPSPKKLKDFLIDRKIAAEARDRLPLLVWQDEIVWVAGVEVSERFKVSSPEGDRYVVWLEGPGASDDRDQSRLLRGDDRGADRSAGGGDPE